MFTPNAGMLIPNEENILPTSRSSISIILTVNNQNQYWYQLYLQRTQRLKKLFHISI